MYRSLLLRSITATLTFFSVAVIASPAYARSYEIPNFDAQLQIQEDSTVRVRETITYRFDGIYHLGYRNILHNKVGSISDIRVIDAATGKPYTYSFRKLDKALPDSWGKFTYSQGFGETVIEWYYDTLRTEQSWILEYTLHGALTFYEKHDELYWNLFTDYDVPIDHVAARVVLPYVVSDARDLQTSIYTTARNGSTYITGNEGAIYSTEYAPAGADVTVAFGFPKGIVTRSAYWKDFFFANMLIWASLFLVISAALFPLLWRHYKERRRDMVVVPEYAPLQNIRPAMSELIVNERLSHRTWPATIIDLAVRGYLTIREEKRSTILQGIGIAIIVVILLSSFLLNVFFDDASLRRVDIDTIIFVMWALFLFFSGFRMLTGGARQVFEKKDYVLTRVRDADTSGLEEYENQILNILFATSDVFATADLRKIQGKKQEKFALAFRRVKTETEDETEKDLHIFERPPKKQHAGWMIAQLVVVALIIAFMQFADTINPTLLILWIAALFALISVIYTVRYRKLLNTSGTELRRKLLGFILYLETAERYRMQNLTPETFEKYLPYAMVFGVEKKWARAFQGINIAPPTWYQGPATFTGGTGFSSSFSATAFTGAFSASFSSAFSASTGTGASGGGGGAGGGGGGGGGGAS